MQIVCPGCQAAYDVPESALTRRSVRCARCGTDWWPLGEPAQAVPERAVPEPADTKPPPEPSLPPVATFEMRPANNEPAPTARMLLAPRDDAFIPEPPPAAPQSHSAFFAWAMTFFIWLALAFAAVTYRESIMQVWPSSARAYGWIGLR